MEVEGLEGMVDWWRDDPKKDLQKGEVVRKGKEREEWRMALFHRAQTLPIHS